MNKGCPRLPPVTPIRIATISENPDPNSAWLRDLFPKDYLVARRPLEWTGFSVAPELMFSSRASIRIAQKLSNIALARGASILASAAKKKPFDVVVSHGPTVTAWTELFLRRHGSAQKHLAFSFNFTNLPTGSRKALMKRAFKSVDEFAVFTNAERALYSHYFGIDKNKFLLAPWGVAPPLRTAPKRAIEGDYFVSLGGEERDYATLCNLARLLPEIQFVVIARPHNFAGLEAPTNMTTFFNLPHDEAWAIVWHALAAIIPLNNRETPCGIVTVVGGMHLGKAQIVTNSMGITDFIKHEETGLTVPAKDPNALAKAVMRLRNDRELRESLGHAAAEYASMHCTENITINFFKERLQSWLG